MKKDIKLPIYGIIVTLDKHGKKIKSGKIKSLIDKSGTTYYKVAIDTIESLILNHAVSGINIKNANYVEGLKKAIVASEKNLMDIGN